MTNKQLDVIKGALPALLTSIALLSSAVYFEINYVIPVHIQLPVVIGFISLPLMYSIVRIANRRYFNETLIDGAAHDPVTSVIEIDKAVLQNTLEQTVLAFGAYTLLSYAVPIMSGALIPALLLLFITGRIFFIVGYKKGAGGRAFGFGLTFYPTVMTLVGSMIYLL